MNRQIYEEAASWLLEFRTEAVDAEARQRFEKWLASSPQHVQAYLELSSVWEIVGAGEPADAEQTAAMIERARSSTNVVPLDVSATQSRNNARNVGSRWRSRPLFSAMLATAASVVLAIVVTSAWLYIQRNTYATAIGEQRSILLSDGSTIALNGRSKVRVRYDDDRRDIQLLAGQAFFKVAKDRTRPFIVTTGDTRVRAVGTSFDVNQRSRATIVTVIEGTVAISSGTTRAGDNSSLPSEHQPAEPRSDSSGSAAVLAAVPGAILLTAGEQATVAADAPLAAKHANVVTATAWTERRLIFEDTPLQDVADEFNRHNRRRLVIHSEGLEDFHVSGGFSSSDPEPLLRFLRAQDGIDVIEQDEQIIVSRRR